MLLGADGQRRCGGHGRGLGRAGPGRAGSGSVGSVGRSVHPPRLLAWAPTGFPGLAFHLPAAEETAGPGVLTSRPYWLSVTGKGTSIRSPGSASPGGCLGLCQAGEVAAVGPAGYGCLLCGKTNYSAVTKSVF